LKPRKPDRAGNVRANSRRQTNSAWSIVDDLGPITGPVMAMQGEDDGHAAPGT
jgi:hypothetical protein